jgi:hypothetical protein
MTYNNSAARLHRILEKAKELGNVETLKAWQTILKLDREDPLEIISSFGRVCIIPNEIQRNVEMIPELENRLFLAWKPDLEKAFRELQWNGNNNQFTRHLSGSLLVALEFVADGLARYSPEKTLDDDRLSKFREDAWKLFEELNGSDIDERTKSYLLKHLKRVVQALDDYPFYGISPLETALDATVGSAITEKTAAESSYNTPAGKSFWTYAGRLALILNITQASIQIGESTIDLLEKAEDVIEVSTIESNVELSTDEELESPTPTELQ